MCVCVCVFFWFRSMSPLSTLVITRVQLTSLRNPMPTSPSHQFLRMQCITCATKRCCCGNTARTSPSSKPPSSATTPLAFTRCFALTQASPWSAPALHRQTPTPAYVPTRTEHVSTTALAAAMRAMVCLRWCLWMISAAFLVASCVETCTCPVISLHSPLPLNHHRIHPCSRLFTRPSVPPPTHTREQEGHRLLATHRATESLSATASTINDTSVKDGDGAGGNTTTTAAAADGEGSMNGGTLSAGGAGAGGNEGGEDGEDGEDDDDDEMETVSAFTASGEDDEDAIDPKVSDPPLLSPPLCSR